jgi:hypothetical protein
MSVIIVKNIDGINYEDLSDKIINKENVVILKNFFDKKKLLRIRSDIYNYFINTPQNVQIDYNHPEEFSKSNFWKFERGVSENQKTLHSFKSYFVNNYQAMPDGLGFELESICESLVELYKLITLSKKDHKKKHHPQLLQYHLGGGFFSSHVHPFEPMRVGVILSLSEQGVDYISGGNGFEKSTGERIDISKEHDVGDVCLFKYSLKHWVLPTDQDMAYEENELGRWSLVVPIY